MYGVRLNAAQNSVFSRVHTQLLKIQNSGFFDFSNYFMTLIKNLYEVFLYDSHKLKYETANARKVLKLLNSG